MPIYHYKCNNCGNKKQMKRDIGSDPPDCEECEEEMIRNYGSEGSPGVLYKSDGFHNTDYD